MEKMEYLSEAFKALDILDEDVFDVSDGDITELSDLYKENDSTTPMELIIDPLAQSEEDLQDSYVGKVILDCNVCQSKIFKDPADVIIDEEAGDANIGEECPYCHNTTGFKVIGQVGEFSDKPTDDVKVTVDNKEIETEALKAKKVHFNKKPTNEAFGVVNKEGIWISDFDDLIYALEPIDNYGIITPLREINSFIKDDVFLSVEDGFITKYGDGSNGEIPSLDDLYAYVNANIDAIYKHLSQEYNLTENKKLDDIDADMDDKKELAKKNLVKAKDDARADRDYKVNKLKESLAKRKSLKESSDIVTFTETEDVDVSDWYFGDERQFGADGKYGLVIDGGHNFKSMVFFNGLDESDIEDLSEDEIIKLLSEKSGKKYVKTIFNGYSPSDWVDAYYPVGEFSKEHLAEIEDAYMGMYKVYGSEEYGTVVAFDSDHRPVKEIISSTIGIPAGNIRVRRIDGYTRIPNYIDESIKKNKTPKISKKLKEKLLSKRVNKLHESKKVHLGKKPVNEGIDVIEEVWIEDFADLLDMSWSGARDRLLATKDKGLEDECFDYIETNFYSDEEHRATTTNLNDFIWFDMDDWFDEHVYNDDEELDESCSPKRKISEKVRKLRESAKKRKLKEEFDKIEIETNGQKIKVESEPLQDKEEITKEEETEVIAPVSDETKDKFQYKDVDINEFDEDQFDELGEKYLRRVYENVKSFKTTKGSTKGNILKLEGLITFKSGKQAKTNFVFEAKTITKTGKLKFIGENKQFAKGKQSFILTGRANGSKFIAESLTYNYRGKDDKTGVSKKLYGTVNK